jgi:hypothetical protein
MGLYCSIYFPKDFLPTRILLAMIMKKVFWGGVLGWRKMWMFLCLGVPLNKLFSLLKHVANPSLWTLLCAILTDSWMWNEVWVVWKLKGVHHISSETKLWGFFFFFFMILMFVYWCYSSAEQDSWLDWDLNSGPHASTADTLVLWSHLQWGYSSALWDLTMY